LYVICFIAAVQYNELSERFKVIYSPTNPQVIVLKTVLKFTLK